MGSCWFSSCALHLMPRDLSTTLETMCLRIRPVWERSKAALPRSKKLLQNPLFPSYAPARSLLPPTLSVHSGTCHNRFVGHGTISHGVHCGCLCFPLACLAGCFGVEFLLHFPFVLKRCNKYCFNSVVVSAWVLVLGVFSFTSFILSLKKCQF